MFQSIPQATQYRIVGSSLMVENTSNMMIAAGRFNTYATRHPDRNGILDYKHIQTGLGYVGTNAIGLDANYTW